MFSRHHLEVIKLVFVKIDKEIDRQINGLKEKIEKVLIERKQIYGWINRKFIGLQIQRQISRQEIRIDR